MVESYREDREAGGKPSGCRSEEVGRRCWPGYLHVYPSKRNGPKSGNSGPTTQERCYWQHA